MIKKVSIVTILLILALAIWASLALNKSEEPTNLNNQTAQQTEGTSNSSKPSPDATTQTGTYTEYTVSAITETSGTKILFFHAPWCPQCRSLDKDITENGAPAGTTIFKVDYDSSQDLRKKYGITIQTTLVLVDDEGNLVKKFVAYSDPSVKSVVENLL